MANIIKIKSSTTNNAIPSSLVQGEFAVNVATSGSTKHKVWVGNASNVVNEIGYIAQRTSTADQNTIQVSSTNNVVGFTVKLGSSQTVNLTEWQNNAGTALAYVTSAGIVYGKGFNAQSQLISGVQDPASAQDAATKNYADTKIPKSTVTTAGDLIYGTGNATVSRLGIGTNGQVLTVSAGALSWATPSSGVTDHGLLTGLGDDDHTQYIHVQPTSSARNKIDLSSDVVAFTILAANAQTANMAEFYDKNNVLQTYIGADGDVTAKSLVVSGNLTVNGTTTNINSTTLVVEDKNIVLGDVATPTEVTADGGGITLKGATDKTFNWVDSTDAWTSSEHMDLASTKIYKIAGTSVLSASTLGSGVTSSSLTSVGTIGTGTWQGSIINSTYGGTGINNGGRTITIGGNINTSCAFSISGNTTGTLTFVMTNGATPEITIPDTDAIMLHDSSTIDGGTY